MKIKEISVSVKYTKNLGNYQSFVAEAGMVVEIEPGDIPGGEFQRAFDNVKDQVRSQLKQVGNGGMNG